jgi:hypothetical protein
MTVAPTPVDRRRRPHRTSLTAVIIVTFALGAVGVALLLRHDASEGSSSHVVGGSGIAATRARDVAAFTRIDLAGSNVVGVRVGGTRSVVVHADDNLISRVTTNVTAGTLTIGNKPGSIKTKVPMHVDVTVPSLRGLRLSGSGVVTALQINSPTLVVELPGSGVLHASGTAARLTVTLSGSGEAQLGQLTAETVRAIVSGSGRIVVNATRTLHATVSGSGEITYGGHPPDVKTKITGSGDVVAG